MLCSMPEVRVMPERCGRKSRESIVLGVLIT